MKQTGERSAGNPHAAFDVAGTGNVARSRYCDTSQPKGRGNREHKLRPKPARQSPTLLTRGRTETWAMEKAKRARKAETPKQTKPFPTVARAVPLSRPGRLGKSGHAGSF